MNLKRELKLTDDAILFLGDRLADELPTMERQKLITLMRLCFNRGVIVHTLEAEKFREMFLREDEDDC